MNNPRSRARCSLVLCVLVLTGCASHKPQASSPPTVSTVAATTRSVQPIITLSGIIAPLQNVALSSDLQEYTDAVYVNEGDRVYRGQLIARLNTADLTANAAEARAHLEQTRYQANLALSQGGDQVRAAQAALNQAKENLKLAQVTLQRDQQL